MSQRYITLAVTVLGMMIYGILLLKNQRAIKPASLLSFGMWSGALIVGGYMIAAAFGLTKADNLYVGMFGVFLVFFSIQELHSMMRRLRSKPLPKPSAKKDGE